MLKMFYQRFQIGLFYLNILFYFNKRFIFRPKFWLENNHSNKFNIEKFNTQKAALAFLEEYNRWAFVKGEKVNEKSFVLIGIIH